MSVIIPLPAISYAGGLDLKSAIYERISIRRYEKRPISLAELANLLWCTQGYVRSGKRAVPSAGATYPIEVYAAVPEGGVEQLAAGIYRYNHHYDTDSHSIQVHREGDVVSDLATACFDQDCVSQAMAAIVVAADYARTTARYGTRGERYVHMEVGHIGQNVSLMAVSIGLGTVMVGAFDDAAVHQVLSLPENLKPLYVMPVGYPNKP